MCDIKFIWKRWLQQKILYRTLKYTKDIITHESRFVYLFHLTWVWVVPVYVCLCVYNVFQGWHISIIMLCITPFFSFFILCTFKKVFCILVCVCVSLRDRFCYIWCVIIWRKNKRKTLPDILHEYKYSLIIVVAVVGWIGGFDGSRLAKLMVFGNVRITN